ncbi:CatB-related O-acetyltransferase [Ferribacterium limneticum]|uniref:CatB-related O-acetyltransferase n=1 Tax=Ferribacterium limneticum TaxID=76259 RepID=UPI001CFC2D8D|nr:CatB-related O-acetyltransferase [Ferribacterium limneticum]UCV29983.1 CatB-related O-acetyltransferase [Ferribacterium limneticum]UCV33902.1 CatB-related O-acetyltransferase [Ferribacterium limneticum]
MRYRSLRAINVLIDSTASVDRLTKFDGYNKVYAQAYLINSTLGRLSYVSPYSVIANCDLGAFCSIGPGVRVGPGFHPMNWISSHPAFYSDAMQANFSFTKSKKYSDSKRVKIGNDVWIGANALVLDGVSIGNGAVIAAGAVITKDVLPYAVVGGIPGRILRMRFDNDKIEQLLSWQWWNLPLDELARVADKFTDQDDWSVIDLQKIAKLKI